MSAFGQRLRAARLSARLTQEQLGVLIGVQKSAISKYERNMIHGITTETVSQLASALNVPVSYLLSEAESEKDEGLKWTDFMGTAPIGERIMHRREWLCMSQTELALEVGLTDRSSISKIETGENHIPVDKVKAYAQALRVTMPELVGCSTTEWSTFCRVWKLLNG